MSDPVEAARSPLNPNDMALAQRRGQPMGGGETIGQWLQGMGISFDDPKDVALQKIKKHAMNATPGGKAQSIAGGGSPPMGGRPPMGGAPSGPPPSPQGQGLAGLVGR